MERKDTWRNQEKKAKQKHQTKQHQVKYVLYVRWTFMYDATLLNRRFQSKTWFDSSSQSCLLVRIYFAFMNYFFFPLLLLLLCFPFFLFGWEYISFFFFFGPYKKWRCAPFGKCCLSVTFNLPFFFILLLHSYLFTSSSIWTFRFDLSIFQFLSFLFCLYSILFSFYFFLAALIQWNETQTVKWILSLHHSEFRTST